MATKDIFCNTPWYELHIYWDGGLGICCQESHRLYSPDAQQYNIATMSIAEWFNSQPVRKFRTDILGDQKLSQCTQCYQEEKGGLSRRLRSNQKSVIFTRTAFDDSFAQSPGRKHFVSSGITATQPIDIHVDLGNHCNLACKMCNAKASSVIASQEVKWGIASSRQYIGTDWTRDPVVWHSFKQQLLAIPGLNNLHFMGGETLLSSRFEDLIDTLIEHKRYEVCLSFVTNGTIFRPDLITKLKKFKRVGIEVSIETVDQRNAYQRQGTDTQLVLNNIKKYQSWCTDSSITVALRSAPSALSIGSYVGLLQYALEQKFIIKSNLCYRPEFLHVKVLPVSVKQQYLKKYQDLLANTVDDLLGDYNASDPNNYQLVIKEQILSCIQLLSAAEPDNIQQLQQEFTRHCEKWDKVYRLDAMQLYPELVDMLTNHDYLPS